MRSIESEERIEKTYHVSWYIIAYKGLFGLSEFLLGISITLFGKSALHWYRIIATRELMEDPHDVFVRLTQHVVPNILTHNTFIALYLIILGAAKLAGAVGLIYRQFWGIDLLVGLTFIMLPFQLVQLAMHPSLPDFLYIVTGLLIALYLVNFRPQEWAKRISNRVRRHQ